MRHVCSFHEVGEKARGNWHYILTFLGIHQSALINKHGACPGCGGKDRFRYDNKDGAGTFICSQGTGKIASGDGFELLIHAGLARDKHHALTLVSETLFQKSQSLHTIKSEHRYTNENGLLVHTVFRTDRSDGSKSFKQLTANGNSPKSEQGFIWYPYRLDKWAHSSEQVFFVEGEKCADALAEIGVQTTCVSGGVNGWKKEYSQWFQNRHVIIFPDNDIPGIKFAKLVETALAQVAASVAIINLPGLKESEDVADWIINGGDYTSLQKLVAAANKHENRATSLEELLNIEIDSRPPLHKHLPSGVTILAGAPKAGKSRLTEIVASSVAEEYKVLYLALEYSIPTAKERFKFITSKKAMENLCLLFQGEVGLWDQGGSEKLKLIVEQEQPKLIILDTLSRLKRQSELGGYEAETKAMAELKAFADEREIDLLCIHHTRKASITDNDNLAERVLGSTALIAVPDNVMVLTRSENLLTLHTTGRLISESKITLELKGDDYQEVDGKEAELDPRADTQRQIIALLKDEHLFNKDIAKILGLDKGQVSRTMKILQQKAIVGKDSPTSPWKLILDGAPQEQNVNSINSVNSGKLFPLDVDEVDKVDGGNNA